MYLNNNYFIINRHNELIGNFFVDQQSYLSSLKFPMLYNSFMKKSACFKSEKILRLGSSYLIKQRKVATAMSNKLILTLIFFIMFQSSTVEITAKKAHCCVARL